MFNKIVGIKLDFIESHSVSIYEPVNDMRNLSPTFLMTSIQIKKKNSDWIERKDIKYLETSKDICLIKSFFSLF